MLSRELAAISDIVTTEIEHINCDGLEELERTGHIVQPHSSTFRLIQVSLPFFRSAYEHLEQVRTEGSSFEAFYSTPRLL